MFQSESGRCISKTCMHPPVVVVRDLSMYSKYELFSCFVLFRVSEFELELSVVGFLGSILPGGSFGTHRYENMLHL